MAIQDQYPVTRPGPGEWYRPFNPNEHCYTAGYGFSPRPPALMERRMIAGYGTACCACLLGFFFLGSFLPGLCYDLLAGLAHRVAADVSPELREQIALLIAAILSMTVPFALYASFVGIPPSCALPARRAGAGLTVSAVCCALAVSVAGFWASGALERLFSLIGVFFYYPDLMPPAGLPARIVYLLNLTLVPAVFEEIAFRGVLMQSLRRFGDAFALLASSVLFSAAHVVPVSIPNAFLMGLVIGYFVLYAGSLRIGVAIHFFHNAMTLLLDRLALADGLPGTLGPAALQLVFLSAGLAALLLLLHRHGALFLLHPGAAANTGVQRLRSFFATPPMAVLLLAVAAQAAEYLL